MSFWKIDSHIAETLKKLPSAPGVYLFRSAEKTVLYVGRATSLRSRVSSYFSGRDSRGERIFQMVDRSVSVETTLTETVLESVILEANLIKKYRPKYNVDLKDDKSFSYFAVTKEEFPRILIVRETSLSFPVIASPSPRGRGNPSEINVGIDCFARSRRASRNDTLRKGKQKKIQSEEYQRIYGPYPSRQSMETVLKILRKIFPFHSASQKTEKGCLYRQIGLCPGPYDGGITNEAYRKNIRSIEYVLRGQKKRLLTTLEKEMRAEAKSENFEKAQILRGQLFAMRHIRDIALLTNNQQPTTHDGEFGSQKSRQLCVVGRRSLRIEAYDISNISGEHAVASMVVFENGEPTKSEYRKFKIQSVEGSNDVAMMREVLARRVRHTEWPTPDLIILDGGKGHLNMAVELWKALDMHIPLAGVAKGPTRKKVDVYTDPEFAPDPMLLADKLLLERIREEAHRFAITYHRKVRGKAFLKE